MVNEKLKGVFKCSLKFKRVLEVITLCAIKHGA